MLYNTVFTCSNGFAFALEESDAGELQFLPFLHVLKPFCKKLLPKVQAASVQAAISTGCPLSSTPRNHPLALHECSSIMWRFSTRRFLTGQAGIRAGAQGGV